MPILVTGMTTWGCVRQGLQLSRHSILARAHDDGPSPCCAHPDGRTCFMARPVHASTWSPVSPVNPGSCACGAWSCYLVQAAHDRVLCSLSEASSARRPLRMQATSCMARTRALNHDRTPFQMAGSRWVRRTRHRSVPNPPTEWNCRPESEVRCTSNKQCSTATIGAPDPGPARMAASWSAFAVSAASKASAACST